MATAVIGTAYTPPNANHPVATTTDANGVTIVTTAAPTKTRTTDTYWAAATATGPANPIVGNRADDHDYIGNYLGIHQLSSPSARYVYTLYFVFALILILLSIGHQTRYRGGRLGALWNKFGLRRYIFKRKRVAEGASLKKKRKQPFTMPSNSQLVAIFVLFAIPLVFCFIGADYIFPKSKLFDYRTSFVKRADPTVTITPSYTIEKAWWTVGSRTGLVSFSLFPLTVLFALKAPPFAIFSVNFLVHTFFDTLTLMHKWSGRLIWLVTAIHVATWSVQLFKDGRNDGSGRSVWVVVWVYDKFIWGAISFFALSLLTVLSLQPVRKRFYETFYLMHVTLVPIVLISAALHFPKWFWWPTAAGGIWVLERLWRFLRYGWVNGWWGGLGNGDRKQKKGVPPPPWKERSTSHQTSSGQTSSERWEMEEMKQAGEGMGIAKDDILSGYDYTSPTSPEGPRPFDARPFSPGETTEWGQRMQHSSQEAEGQYHPQPYGEPPHGALSSDSHYTITPIGEPNSGDHHLRPQMRSEYSHDANIDQSSMPLNSARPRPPKAAPFPRGQSAMSLYSNAPLPVPRPIQAAIPAGYALAQLLPSRMLRLTLRLPKPFKWAPGQNVLLQIREISIWTSHPFSIVSVYDADVEQEIVLLVKARKGFTLDLWEETRRRMEFIPGTGTESGGPIGSGGDDDASLGPPGIRSLPSRQSFYFAASSKKLSTPKPVFFRALVDGPYGSSARVRWGDHSTVLVICGGSGVSFGIAILTYVCECIASRDRQGPGGKGGRHFITRRARFVWIVREFAEVLWVSNLIRRCLDLVPATQLQVDIFVTNFASSANKSIYNPEFAEGDELAPPKPRFARDGGQRSRSNSNDSLNSALSVDSNTDLAYLADRGDTEAQEDRRDSVLELTNFDEDQDAEDEERPRAELELSKSVKKQGRILRARSRRKTLAKQRLPIEAKDAFEAPPTHAQEHHYPPLPFVTGGLNSSQILPPSARNFVSPSPSYHSSPLFLPEDKATLLRSPDPAASISFPQSRSNNRFSLQSDSNFAESYSSHDTAPHNGVPFERPRFDSFNSLRDSGAATPAESIDQNSFLGTGESTRGLVGGAWDEHRQSFVRVDVESEDKGQWMDEGDEEDLNIVAEMARPGRPKLEKIIQEEVDAAEGTIAIASCGPVSLNATVRNIAASLISLSRAGSKGRAGHIAQIYTEEYGY